MDNHPETNPTKEIPRIDRYKKLLRRSAEQVFVDDEENGGVSHAFSVLVNKQAPRRDKTKAAFQIVSHYLPQKTKDSLKNKLNYTQEGLPFNPDEYKLTKKVDNGAMNDVFLLESQREDAVSYVMKVSIETLGEKDIDKLVKAAAEQKKDYETVSGMFEHMPGFVPPEHFIVAHGPRKGEPAVITIQPFIGGVIRDVFEDFTEQELQTLVTNSVNLQTQFNQFIEVVDQNNELLDDELDLIGKNNLAIVGDEGNERLLLLDAHSRSPHARSDHFREEIERRVDYLRNVTH